MTVDPLKIIYNLNPIQLKSQERETLFDPGQPENSNSDAADGLVVWVKPLNFSEVILGDPLLC